MLKVSKSCEIDDLICEITEVSGKSLEDVEKAFFSCGKYPTGCKTYITEKFGGFDTGFDWLDEALSKVLTESGITSNEGIEVTDAI